MLLRLKSSSSDETQQIAAQIASIVALGDFIVLTGDLGAGKTCFSQGFAKGLGVSDQVTSPTFALANEYNGKIMLHHLDVYRLNSYKEAYDLALEELQETGVVLIEWGEKIKELFPSEYLHITMKHIDDINSRVFEIRLKGSRWLKVQEELNGLVENWNVDA